MNSGGILGMSFLHQCSPPGLLLTLTSEAKMGSAADDTNLRQQDLKTRPPVGPSRGQGQGEGQDE